jgi:hypothetical protein
MKTLLKKLISKKLLELTLTIFGLIAIFQWIVIPGFNEPNGFLNILSILIGILSGIFVLLHVKELFFPSQKSILESGETELDYIPIKPKKRKSTKKLVLTKTRQKEIVENIENKGLYTPPKK